MTPTEHDSENGAQFEVVLRLVDGDRVEAGSFRDEAAARAFAEQLIASTGAAGWPSVGGRYIRPDAIVSVDLVRGEQPRWTGSTGRATSWSGRPGE